MQQLYTLLALTYLCKNFSHIGDIETRWINEDEKWIVTLFFRLADAGFEEKKDY